jgi:hypothetical protein
MSALPVEPAETLAGAREWLRGNVEDGAACPCCGQFAKVYRRKIHSAMARDLIIAYRKADLDWFHVRTTLGHDGGDFAKLAYWQLIVEHPGEREDGSSRAGWWRISLTGEAFALGKSRIPKYARIYNGRLLGFSDDRVGIRDALGSRFRYDDLMAGV